MFFSNDFPPSEEHLANCALGAVSGRRSVPASAARFLRASPDGEILPVQRLQHSAQPQDCQEAAQEQGQEVA